MGGSFGLKGRQQQAAGRQPHLAVDAVATGGGDGADLVPAQHILGGVGWGGGSETGDQLAAAERSRHATAGAAAAARPAASRTSCPHKSLTHLTINSRGIDVLHISVLEVPLHLALQPGAHIFEDGVAARICLHILLAHNVLRFVCMVWCCAGRGRCAGCGGGGRAGQAAEAGAAGYPAASPANS